MDITSGQEVGLALCKALGEDPNLVSGIIVTARVGEVASVTIERAMIRPTLDPTVGALASMTGRLRKVRVDPKS